MREVRERPGWRGCSHQGFPRRAVPVLTVPTCRCREAATDEALTAPGRSCARAAKRSQPSRRRPARPTQPLSRRIPPRPKHAPPCVRPLQPVRQPMPLLWPRASSPSAKPDSRRDGDESHRQHPAHRERTLALGQWHLEDGRRRALLLRTAARLFRRSPLPTPQPTDGPSHSGTAERPYRHLGTRPPTYGQHGTALRLACFRSPALPS